MNHSPNLWLLAWRRLCTDRIGMLALTIVVAYLFTLTASATGLIASGWDNEVAINYAAPTFISPQKALVHIRTQKDALPENARDPLRHIIDKLNAEISTEAVVTVTEKRNTLPFGADKWGRDIIKKTIKGAETSITVGLVAAVLATLLGTISGAFSGYCGGWIDDPKFLC